MIGTAPSRARGIERLALLAIVGLTCIAYAPVARNGLIWDDDVHIAKPSLHSRDGMRLIWTDPAATQQYYPLAHTAFWLQWLAWGERPLGYHIINVLLHALNAVLFWCVLKRLAVPGAILAAAIFAVHPVHVESVAWITELKNTLMGGLTLLSLLAWLRFHPLDEGGPRPLRWRWYVVATALFAAALLAKTVASALPPAILVIIWWKRGRLEWRRDVLPLAPWLIIGAALGLLIAHFERIHWGSGAENFGGEFFTWTPAQRTLVAGWSLWFYIDKLFWPSPLAFFYPRWTIDPSDWMQWLWPAAAIGLVAALFFLRRRIGRGPLAAALLFGGAMLPALGFINLFWQIYSYVADHMQYLPSLSVFALVAAGVALAMRRLPPALGRALGGAAAVLVCGLAFLTWERCHAYRDLESLYRDTIAKSPDSWLSCYNLAIVLEEQGRREEAERMYRRAIEIRPGYDDARCNLANLLAAKGTAADAAEALANYSQAIEAWVRQADAQRANAARYQQAGEAARAARHNGFARQIDAKRARSVNNMGSLLRQLGREEEALNAFQAAAAADPDLAVARFNLGLLLAQRGKATQAAAEFRQALRSSSAAMRTAVRAVAQAQADRGRYADAVRYYDLILEIAPDDFAVRADRDRSALMLSAPGQ